MKLEKIKLSGFKSFVDQTIIPIHCNLTAIVGPNGCGKSNIIDAVRWVMGESSAKHLRGGNMADVIFNGSSTRKPVSMATVELLFDNSEGKVGGEYSQYAKLAIKRQVSRDGMSLYSLNGTRCRRKDITDLFLGTGLGARSYAIIEQGTISRMVEAKPDELRVHIEEAAGISKYKERRHETEQRISNTRENLDRLQDLREEVGSQLKNLHKQAQKAEKYTELKKQQRQLKLELLAMRWQTHQHIAAQLDTQLQTVADEHNRLFGLHKDTEQNLENQRIVQKTLQQQHETEQAGYYQLANEVSRLEQAIAHNEQNQRQTAAEIVRLQQQVELTASEYQQELALLEELKQTQAEAQESLAVAEERLEQVLENQQHGQQQHGAWQQQWEQYLRLSSKQNQQIEVQQAKINQLEVHNRQLSGRLEKLQQQHEELASSQLQLDLEILAENLAEIEEQREIVTMQLIQSQQQSLSLRQQLKTLHEQLHESRSILQNLSGKLTSLELLQQHAMGKDKKNLTVWLESVELANKPRLAEFLRVENGWELAVEVVLNDTLEAVCLRTGSPPKDCQSSKSENVDIDAIIKQLPQLKNESVVLFEGRELDLSGFKNLTGLNPTLSPLLDKISTPYDLSPFLTGVYCADNLEIARQFCKQLQTHESIITLDGIWLGRDWLKTFAKTDSHSGVLQREQQSRQLKQQRAEIELKIGELEEQIEALESELKNLDKQREQWLQQDKNLNLEFSSINAQFSAVQTRLEQQTNRLTQLVHEMAEVSEHLQDNTQVIAEAELLKQDALEQNEALAEQKIALEQANSELQNQQYQLDQAVNEARQQLHSIQSQLEASRSTENAALKQLERLRQQQQQQAQRLQELQQQPAEFTPIAVEKQLLAELQTRKQASEQSLKQQRQTQQELEAVIKQLAQTAHKTQQALEQQKQGLDEIRFAQQENQVRQQTIMEQLEGQVAELEIVLANLSPQANEGDWKKQLDELTQAIERLGTINLTAIEEYKTQSERANFLETQYKDLTEALEILELAITKIDKETRLRFKETFDKINLGLQTKFPKLFGGGQAYLELTEQNLLESGVNIIARPPGKKNSSIHLLSGGEKALTAVALVFSIFELNPAPFCLLDEVDAPLDDANVGRFSKMVEEMSETVQFLFISHNKVTMEIAEQLTGVTMKEPGVSRMVAVNIEDAVQLAEH
jgi:chromosome segregation protein